MAAYYFAACDKTKERFESPLDFSIKSPGCFHPENPFPGMFVMKLAYGYKFFLTNDYIETDRLSYKDITEDVYAQYLETFSKKKSS
jgi:hypothetical protein